MSKPNESDLQWLSDNHPRLLYFRSGAKTIISGRLTFNRTFQEETIYDTYSISVELADDDKQLPTVFETSGRLRAVMKKRKVKTLADLHCYPNGALCLAAPQDLTLSFLPEPSLYRLFENYIIPFLYSQSYYEKHGKWPWPHLPHDAPGLLDWFRENAHLPDAARETVKELRKLKTREASQVLRRGARSDSFNPRASCLCGSGETYTQCHPQFLQIAFKLRSMGSSNRKTKRKKRSKRRR